MYNNVIVVLVLMRGFYCKKVFLNKKNKKNGEREVPLPFIAPIYRF